MTAESSDRLWTFCPLKEYQPPSGPASARVLHGFSDFWRRFQGWSGGRDSSSDAKTSPQAEQQQSVLQMDIDAQASALQEEWQEWLDDPDQSGVKILVGPPYSGVGRAVHSLVAGSDIRCLEPPTNDEILSGGKDWLEKVDALSGCTALPGLESLYLRHHDGFDLIRGVLDRIIANGQWILHGSSWAWAYFDRVLEIESVLGEPLTPAPVSVAELKRWVTEQLAPDEGEQRLFIDKGSNKTLFSLARTDGGKWLNEDSATELFSQVTSHARGIAGIVEATWELILQSGSDRNGARLPVHSVAMSSWSEVKTPALPGQVDPEDLMLLHSMLLHHPGPRGSLAAQVSLLGQSIGRRLARLEASGIVRSRNEKWEVTPLGYPNVRSRLKSEGYLVDAL